MPLRPRSALIAAGGGVLLLILTWFLAFHVGFFRDADQSVFSGFYDLSHHARADSLAGPIADLCDPKPFAVLAAIPIVIALLRRRYRLALGIWAILLGASVTTQLLKPLLAQPRAASLLGGVSPVGPVSWPSGHATAAMSWALCPVLAVPGHFRPAAAAFGAALAVAVSYSFLLLGWHYPSDVLGGYLVAAIWTMLGLAALLAVEFPSRRVRAAGGQRQMSVREAITPPVAALGLAVLLAVVLAVARPHPFADYARAHRAFMLGAAGIALLALAIATAVVLALRPRERARR